MKAASSKKPVAIQIISQEKGQLIIEYVLLLFIVVFIANTLSKGLVGRGEGRSGAITAKWGQILETIGSDLGD